MDKPRRYILSSVFLSMMGNSLMGLSTSLDNDVLLWSAIVPIVLAVGFVFAGLAAWQRSQSPPPAS